MQSKRNYFFSLLFMAFLLYQGCYPLPDRVPKMKDGKEYGDTEGLFRHRWWNYYERGLSFADGEFWQDAEPDLREAIRQRNTDKRRSRTYGLHFIDYFPHRELGIVLFEQGRIEEAEKELEISYSDVKSAKAALYLDRVRKAIIEKKQLAHRAPEIIAEPLKQDPDKPFLITIRGVAKSDAFVRHITVNQQEVRIDVSKQIVDFQSEVPLVPGENNIRITAQNLMGESSEIFSMVNVDNTGPVISVDDLNDYQIPENSIYVADDSGIAEILVNKQKILFKYGITEFRFPDKPLSFPATDEIVIEAKDIAGNITTARLPLSKTLSKLLADNSDLPIGILLAQHKNESPSIDLRHPSEDEQLTYQDYAFVDGNISDREGVRELLINNEQVLKSPAKNYFFSKRIKLNKGKNEIIVRGTTVSGKSVSQKVEITRKSLSDIRPPLKLAITDFKRTPENSKEYMTHKFENTLESVIKEHGRFAIDVADKKEDCILKGNITETQTRKGVEISVDLFDIKEDYSILEGVKGIIDAYSESNDNISGGLANAIYKKLCDEIPLIEGKILPERNSNNQIAINIGTEAKLKKGMKVMIYDVKIRKEGGKIQDLTYPLGQATLKVVNEGASWASLDKDLKYEAIKVYHLVVTR